MLTKSTGFRRMYHIYENSLPSDCLPYLSISRTTQPNKPCCCCFGFCLYFVFVVVGFLFVCFQGFLFCFVFVLGVLVCFVLFCFLFFSATYSMLIRNMEMIFNIFEHLQLSVSNPSSSKVLLPQASPYKPSFTAQGFIPARLADNDQLSIVFHVSTSGLRI